MYYCPLSRGPGIPVNATSAMPVLLMDLGNRLYFKQNNSILHIVRLISVTEPKLLGSEIFFIPDPSFWAESCTVDVK